jgi:signal recognition particle GTPase
MKRRRSESDLLDLNKRVKYDNSDSESNNYDNSNNLQGTNNNTNSPSLEQTNVEANSSSNEARNNNTPLLTSIREGSQAYTDYTEEGRIDEANRARHGVRRDRDSLVERLSREEDRRSDEDPVVESLRNQLITADQHIRDAGMHAVIDDSDSPSDVDSALGESDSDFGGDI